MDFGTAAPAIVLVTPACRWRSATSPSPRSPRSACSPRAAATGWARSCSPRQACAGCLHAPAARLCSLCCALCSPSPARARRRRASLADAIDAQPGARPSRPPDGAGRRRLGLPRRRRRPPRPAVRGRTPLRRLGARAPLLAVEVLDPRELELPDVGMLALVDPETGAQREVFTTAGRCGSVTPRPPPSSGPHRHGTDAAAARAICSCAPTATGCATSPASCSPPAACMCGRRGWRR